LEPQHNQIGIGRPEKIFLAASLYLPVSNPVRFFMENMKITANGKTEPISRKKAIRLLKPNPDLFGAVLRPRHNKLLRKYRNKMIVEVDDK